MTTFFSLTRMEEYSMALDYHLQALESYQSVAELHEEEEVEAKQVLNLDMAQTLHNVGHSYAMLGFHDKAVEYLQQALARFNAHYKEPERPRNSTDLLHTLYQLGLSTHHLGRYREAREHLTQALDLYKRYERGDHPHISNILKFLESVCDKLGDTH